MSAELKLLDAYTKADKDAYFGREREVEALYQLFFRARALVVYGPSGTGKTSLLQCGLANRLPETDWTPIFVRRRRNLNASVLEALTGRPARGAVSPAEVVKAVEALYLAYLRPVCLILDQFEELYVMGDETEQRQFGGILKALLRAKAHCRVVLSLREDYLGRLDGLEAIVPDLLDYRLRVEPMSRKNLKAVIVGTALSLDLRLEHGQATAERIIDNLDDPRDGVQLAYLQVYLDRLRSDAIAAQKPGHRPVISDEIVEATGRLGDVLAAFLDRQTLIIQSELARTEPQAPADAVRRVLEALAAFEGTKIPRTRAELAGLLPDLRPDLIDDILDRLQKVRLVNRFQGEYELAHDALAQRVAESRSAPAKYRMQLEKMVHDARELFERAGDDRAARRNRSYLTSHQLALLWPYLGSLTLEPEDAAFVRLSRRDALMARVREVGAYVAVAVLVATLAIAGAVVDQPGAAAPVGELLTNLGQPGVARWVLTPALALHPGDTTLLLQRGDTYLRSADRAETPRRSEMQGRAERDFVAVREIALREGGTDSSLFNQLCWFRGVHNGDLTAARADCDRAVKRADILDSRALVLLKLGDYPAALADYEAELQVTPESAADLYGKAMALRGMRRPEGQAALKRALEADNAARKRKGGAGADIASRFYNDYWFDPPWATRVPPGSPDAH